MKIQFSAVLTLAIAGAGGVASAATLYVDRDGRGGACDDGRSRSTAQNPATPVCSVIRGNAIAQEGDTVLIREALYDDFRSTFFVTKSGLTLKSYPGETATLDFALVANTDGKDNRGLYIHEGSDITIQGLEIRNAPSECVQNWSARTRILGNHIHHCGISGDINGVAQDCIDTD